METALAQCDEVISLLATLGAEVDVPIKSSNTTYTHRLSLLQWTSKAVSFWESKSTPEPIQAPVNLPDSPAGDAWCQYRAYLATVLPHSKTEDMESASSPRLHRLRGTERTLEEEYALATATKEYLTFAESVLRAHGAIIPEGASTSEESALGAIGTQTPITSQESGYMRHGKHMSTLVPLHLKVFYDELYEACWKGDNASIRELCLPKQVAEGKEPIQIVVQTRLRVSFASSGALLVSAVPESSSSKSFFHRLDAIPCRCASPSLGYCTARACNCGGSVSAPGH
jgi:hypothetical protein